MAGGFQLEWSIEGEKQLSRVLRGVANDVQDLRKPFKESGEKLKRTFEDDVFRTQGAAIGEKWARLSPYTVAQKARLGYSAAPLIRTGAMKEAFRSIASSDQAVIYNTAEYFKYHQSNKPRRRIPRRVMMKLGENQREEVVKIFQRYLRESLRKHG